MRSEESSAPDREQGHPPGEPPHPLFRMFLLATVASLIGIAIALSIDWFPVSAANSTKEIDTLWYVLLIVSVPIFVLVMTVAIYSVVRFRARPGDMGDGAPIHGNARLEVVWVGVPLVLLTTLAIYAAVVLGDVEAKKPNELQVRVIGQQYTWHFQYPQYGNVTTTALYLPKDRPVKFDIVTRDVLHSFWVPSFRLKQDAVPGLTTHMRLTPSRLGRYDVVCTELCGLGHSTMRNLTYVVNTPTFNAYINQQKHGGGGAPGGGTASAGGHAIPAAG